MNKTVRITPLLMLLLTGEALAVTCTSVANKDWNQSSAWSGCGGVQPAVGSSVIIAAGTTIKADSNTNAVANITINAGGTLQGNNGNTITLTGNFINNGTFTAPAGSTVAFTGTNQTIGGTSSTTFANLTVGAGTVLTLSGNIVVTGTTNLTAANLVSTCPTNYTITNTLGTVLGQSCAGGGGGGGPGFVVGSPTSCASVTGVGTIAWVNPLNAGLSDNIYATATGVIGNTTTNYLNCTGYNFAVPAGAVISGITAFVERKTSGGTITDAFVYLIKGGTISTALNGATATAYTTKDVIEAHGGSANLWGTTWTAADVNATNFGVAFAAKNTVTTSTKSRTLSVDHIQVRVDYVSPNAPADFDVYDAGTTPAGSIAGPITTKIAGQPFTLDIAALNATKTALLTSANITAKVELLDASNNTGALDANGCRATWTVIQTLPNQTFGAGDAAITGSGGRHRITPNITESNAWADVRVRVSYPATGTPTKIGCSGDNFAIRPGSLSGIAVSDQDSMTAGAARNLNNTAASGGNVHKAGRPFKVVATAYNAAATPAVTTNYAGSPDGVAATTLPVGGVNGVFAPGTWTANAGTVTTTTASYDDVGVFNLTLEDRTFAAVDSADTPATCAGYYVCSAATAVGRFVPDHFELKDASVDPVANPAYDPLLLSGVDTAWLPTAAHRLTPFCAATATPFTYIGQAFGYTKPPQATIKAMDALGGWVQNYDFAKLTAAGVTQTYAAASGMLDVALAMQAPTLAANADYTNGNGSAIIGSVTVNAADKLAFVRGATPVASFNADISLTLDVADKSENAVAGNGNIAASAPLLFASIPFATAPLPAGAQMRYGRLLLSNALGSEKLNLPVPTAVQYYNGTTFVANTADSCTTVTSANITLSNYQGGLSSTNLASPAHINTNGAFTNGVANLRINKPSPSARGSADVTVNLTAEGKSYLQGGTGYNQNPSAKVSFGVYKGSKEVIYMREN